MNQIVLCALVFVWWVVGAASFVYWWTEDDDLTLKSALLMILVGFWGPVNIVFGFMIHADADRDPVIMRRRGGS